MNPEDALAYYFALCGLVLLTAAAAVWQRRRRVQRAVFDNLDSAYGNGYFEPGEHLHGATSWEVAGDLSLYAEDFGDTEPWKLEPHVQTWLRYKGLEL